MTDEFPYRLGVPGLGASAEAHELILREEWYCRYIAQVATDGVVPRASNPIGFAHGSPRRVRRSDQRLVPNVWIRGI